MKIGIVGYQGAGKSTLFEWLTGETADPAQAHRAQNAMATVPEQRVEPLCQIYQPKKITLASLELVDTPGLSRSHEGSAARLATIRESGCLVMVVAAFAGNDAAADFQNFADDLLIADLDIVSGRIERLREQVKKPRPDRDELQAELAAIEPLHEAMEEGRSLREMELTPDQQKAIRSFQLFSEKPRLLVVNTPDDEEDLAQYQALAGDGIPVFALSLGMQLELTRMEEAERHDFCAEMGVTSVSPHDLVRAITDTSGQMLFFTCGEKEVRTWMIRQGGTAVEAAGNIHTDLAKGFIRAECMNADDVIRLGSEREVKAQSLWRQEPKDYVIQDGDVLLIRHN